MKTFKFYGICGNLYKLDDKVWEAIENPSDGYRSFLESVELRKDDTNYTFSHSPLATVRIESASDIDGWRLFDVEDNHLWLEIGTDTRDSYYPCFIFAYHPKANSEWERFILD